MPRPASFVIPKSKQKHTVPAPEKQVPTPVRHGKNLASSPSAGTSSSSSSSSEKADQESDVGTSDSEVEGELLCREPPLGGAASRNVQDES
eukprot:GSA120T00011936001.1